MEIVTIIVEKVGEYTVGAVGRELGYVFSYKKYVDNLKTEIKKLGHARERVQHSVDAATRNGEEIEADVQDWQSRAHKITEEADNILKGEDQANTKCLSLSFPNLLSRRKLSREAKNKVQEITSEIQKAEKFPKVSYRPTPQSSIVIKGYEAFETRRLIFKGVMEALRDPNVSMIGLYGMAGAGKTMMAKQVASQTKEEKLFDKAIMVTVSQTPNFENIQQEIAEKLGLHLDEKILSPRADRLRDRLSQEKSILIVVDDVWEKVDLDYVGISFRDDQKHCKILLTSRFHDVLSNDMGVEKNFKVGILSDSESMSLFDKMVGDSAKKSDEFQRWATLIVEECGGLPLAITVVASALKNKEIHVWENALQELQTSNPNNIKGMNEKVYSSIKLSYNFLSEDAKSLLLLSSLFEEDANIDIGHLLFNAMGMGLFQDITNLAEARNKMLTLIEHLKDSSLLIYDEDDEDYSKIYVKLHDVIRDFAIPIASRDKRWYVIRNVDNMEESIKSNEKLQDPIAISLLLNDTSIVKLPERLETPQLRLLLTGSIRYNNPLKISDPFFEGLKELRVLVLQGCLRANQLPSSFCFLQNLKALCLRACKLRDIALIGKLKNLEMLDLSYSNVVELGREIGQLTQLRLLNLNYCDELRVIQPNVICSLTRLEELTMRRGFTDWEVEGVDSDRTNASLGELKNLARLTTLDLCIPDINAMPKHIFMGEKLERYFIILGIHWSKCSSGYHDLYTVSRGLELNLHKRILVEEYGLGNLLKRSVELYFGGGPEGMNNVVYELDTYKAGFPQCEFLQVKNNVGIQYIVNLVGQSHPCSVFQRLETLWLTELLNLEKICHGKLAAHSFGKLRHVKVSYCNRLKNLFSFPTAQLLEKIEVSDCEAMEEIFMYEGEGGHDHARSKIEFPQLRVLQLGGLPQLQQYCTVLDTTRSHMPFFNEKVVLYNLEKLKLYKLKFHKLMDDKFGGEVFHNLARLEVFGCHVKSLISSSMTSSLVHLKILKIIQCDEIELVITDEGRLEKVLLPKLEFLELRTLPKLKRFYAGDYIECPSLVTLYIEECDKMEAFINDSEPLPTHVDNQVENINLVGKQPLFNHKVVLFSKLKVLKIQDNGFVSHIWQNEEQIKEVTHLRELWLGQLSSLKHLWKPMESQVDQPASKLQAFEVLETLCISKCPELSSLMVMTNNSGVSLKNLKRLGVENCDALTNLIVPSSAKCLQQLAKLTISECQGMTQVIGLETDEEDQSEIVFGQLQSIRLFGLNNLKNFYSGKKSMTFPKLKKLAVIKCREMKSFSGGGTSINTPMLENIIFKGMPLVVWEEDIIVQQVNQIWEAHDDSQLLEAGDVNASLRKFWEDNNPTTPTTQ